jgi:hypothetical protein
MANNVTDHHLALMRAYFAVLQRIDRFSWLIWIPVGWPGIRIPMLTSGLRILASSHIRRVIEILDRAYQRRLAVEDAGADGDDWKKLHEQAESMDAGLPPFVFAKWVIAILAFASIFLVARSLPHGDLVIKMAGAVLTLNPGKLAELATEAGALEAFGRLAFVLLIAYIALTPIFIYHFSLKRSLFNRPELLSTSSLDLNFKTICGELSISSESIYVLERNIFMRLGDPVVSELPLDLLSVVIAFLYHAVGPGIIVGIFAWQVYLQNRSAGRQLFVVAFVNCIIGLGAALVYLGKMRQRSKQLASA